MTHYTYETYPYKTDTTEQFIDVWHNHERTDVARYMYHDNSEANPNLWDDIVVEVFLIDSEIWIYSLFSFDGDEEDEEPVSFSNYFKCESKAEANEYVKKLIREYPLESTYRWDAETRASHSLN